MATHSISLNETRVTRKKLGQAITRFVDRFHGKSTNRRKKLKKGNIGKKSKNIYIMAKIVLKKIKKI